MKTTDRERDQQVIDALDEYLAAQHAGRPIPRTEFLARHPDLAEDLERYLANLDLVMGEEDEEGEQPNRIIGGTLGDFLIRREIGRGGMGVVYEAEQISLARRVALKVLPFAAVFDERQLQRFKNEAQAAALLHHPHIVPVYAVGQDRGVHYYAMQYIDGRSLAQIVDELQHEPAQPSQPLSVITKGKSTRSAEYCRGVARIGIQAAEALALAHDRGVVHRDIKPANLMVDPLGHLWVTDFGLAAFQRSDTQLTMTGDLLGTVRYMSPEQVRGNRAAIDHRTDIYSLGATLYELLTLRVAYPGESPHRVMQRIATEDPPPPRKLNPSIPVDLETIVLKALEKDVGSRYALSSDLAADLDSFLANRPIEARRPSIGDRSAKWARRHRPLVFTAFLGLIITTAALGYSVWSIAREQVVTEENRLRAERGLELAEDAIEEMLAEVGSTDLLRVPRMVPVRRRLLGKALAYYERLIEERPDDPGLLFQHAIARKRIGDIEALLGHIDNAERAYDQAAAAFEQCGNAARSRLRDLAWNRAKLSLRTGRLAAALESLDRAEALGGEVEIEQAWIDAARGSVLFEQGEDERARRSVESARGAAERIEAAATLRAYCSRTLGLICSVSGDWQRAEAAFRQALEEQDSPGVDRAEIENSRLQLGSALRKLGRIEEAEQVQRAAAKWRAEAAKSFPSVPALAGAAADEAAQLFETRSWDWESPGIASLEGSVAQLARLAREFPAEPAYKNQWADALTNQADAQGKPEEHLDLLTRVLELRREVARDFPEPLRHSWSLAAARTNQNVDANALQEGVALWEELVRSYPDRAHLKEGWADGLYNFSVTKTGTGAAALLRRALELYTDLAARNPAVVSYPQKLSTTYRSLAVVLQHYDVDAAIEAVEQAVHWSRGVSREHPDVATYQHLHAFTIGQLGAFLIALDRPGVDKALTEAVETGRALVLRRETNDDRWCHARNLGNLADRFAASDRAPEARLLYAELVACLEPVAPQPVPHFRKMVSNAMWAGGRLDPERRQELWKGSVHWTRRWAELQPGVPAQDVLLARCEEFGRLLVDQGAWEQAGEIATVAVATAKDLVRLSKGKRFRRRLGGATTLLAEIQIGKGEQLAAAESFGRADSIFAALPPDPALRQARVELLLSQSLVLHDLGRELEARHAIESGLALEPAHWLARCRLAWLQTTSLDSRVRDPAAALKHAMLAFEQRESAELLHTIGVALCAQGKPEKAVGVLRRCAKAGVDGPTSVSLAWANALLGNKVVSRAELKRAERWHTKQDDADAFYLDTRRRVLAILADEEEGSRSER